VIDKPDKEVCQDTELTSEADPAMDHTKSSRSVVNPQPLSHGLDTEQNTSGNSTQKNSSMTTSEASQLVTNPTPKPKMSRKNKPRKHLREMDVITIRGYIENGIDVKTIASYYDVSLNVIYNIKNYTSWSKVTDKPQPAYRVRVTSNPTYVTWMNMMNRCYRDDHSSSSYYKGRGIVVCDEWHDFDRFVDDMGQRPFPKAQLDRIDNSDSYYPDNVRWATATQNMRNTRVNVITTINGVTACLSEHAENHGLKSGVVHRRYQTGIRGEALVNPDSLTARYFTHDGKTLSISAWERELGFNKDTLWSRIHRRGLSFEEAISLPLNYHRRSTKHDAEQNDTNNLE